MNIPSLPPPRLGPLAAFIVFCLCIVIAPVCSVHAQQTGDAYIAALCDSGTACLDRGEIKNARAIFREALELDSKYPPALIGMGRVWIGTRAGAERAIECFQQAIRLNPLDPVPHYYKAKVHVRLAPTDAGTDNAQFALLEIRTVLDLNPSHPDAYQLMGTIYRDIYQDYLEAERAFLNQTVIHPGHLPAYEELLKTRLELGKWDDAVSTAEELLRRDPDELEAYPYLAAAHWKAGRGSEAMAVFDRYFARIPTEEMSLYLDLSPVLTQREQREFNSLDDQGKHTFWAHYWRQRDPDPKNDFNERLLEHYIRVAYARIEFGQHAWPWDSRGDYLVRYGEPDYRSSRGNPIVWDLVAADAEWIRKKREFQEEIGVSSVFYETCLFDSDFWEVPGNLDKRVVVQIAETMLFNSRTGTLDSIWVRAIREAERRAFRDAAMATPERWVYLDRGIDLEFEDYTHNLSYTVAGLRSSMVVDQMERVLPVISPEEEKIEYIDPMDLAVTFRGKEGRTAVEYAFALHPDDFGAFRSPTGSYATLDVEVNLYTEEWERAAGYETQERRLELIPQANIRGIPIFVDATRLEAVPGMYRLTAFLIDPETGQRSTAEEFLDLPDYSGTDLMISDILPASSISVIGPGRSGRFIREDLEVIPLPGRNLGKNQPLFIYFEVYNLTRDQFGSTRYLIEYTVAEARETGKPLRRLYQSLKELAGIERQRAVLSSEFTQTGIRPDLSSYLEIDMSDVPDGIYELWVSITDLISGESVSSGITFLTLPPIPDR